MSSTSRRLLSINIRSKNTSYAATDPYRLIDSLLESAYAPAAIRQHFVEQHLVLEAKDNLRIRNVNDATAAVE
jgi:hypothetical protein